jgi:hypothetical protein
MSRSGTVRPYWASYSASKARVARLVERAVGHGEAHDSIGLRAHGLEQLVDRRRVEGAQPHVAAAHHLVGDGGGEEADRRSDARVVGHDHLFDAQLLGQTDGVQRCGAAERDHRSRRDLLAALDGMHARCVRHVLVDDLDHGQGRSRGIQV